ncbi:MAG: glucose-6-phosphate dehydrogenase assembly protein OpcA [Verrucomicrobiota bacterium JB023]|nr:glucose-6-phosphate dehydrogenase assembly protein OpcA [Verrucomicrobiota bacterium JB023]
MNEILGKPVAVGDIAKELKKLWEADEAATNASLMNFAIYSEQTGSLERNAGAIQSLTREHACRAILVEMEREAPEAKAEAWITAQCHLAHGKKSVCCEQLAFLLKGKAIGRMRNTVFSNLGSDLPLVFWWQGELSELFEERLYRIMDRLIVDSSEWCDLASGFGKIRSAVNDSRCLMAVQDLEWTRCFHFRLAVASLFDDPIAQESLPSIKHVTIGGDKVHRSCQLMFTSWLATQAGWTLSEMRPDGCVFTTDSRQVEVTFLNEGEAPLTQVELSDGQTTISVRRQKDAPHLDLALLAEGHEVRQVAPADPLDQVELVAEQLSRGGKNSLFRSTWPMLFQMIGMEKGEPLCA